MHRHLGAIRGTRLSPAYSPRIPDALVEREEAKGKRLEKRARGPRERLGMRQRVSARRVGKFRRAIAQSGQPDL